MSNLKAIVTSIIQKMNFWEQNAKKIDELTPMETVVDTAKIHVSDGGTSKSLLLSKLIQAATLSTENQIITIGEITLVDNDITIPNAQWKIAGVTYTKITPTVINIPFSATGKTRIDILVANTLNEIVKVIGFETTGVAVRPNIPLNTVLVTQIVVTDSALESVYSPLTTDELEAIHNSNAPSALNPFATMDDVGSGGGGGSQDLQSVTDVGNSTMNTINAFMYYAGVGTGLNTLISDETGQLITRGLLLIRDGSFETNSKSKPIYIGDSILGNPEFFLPDKVTGNYIIATIDEIPTLDTTPTDGSTNPVTSNGVYQADLLKADKTTTPIILKNKLTNVSTTSSQTVVDYVDLSVLGTDFSLDVIFRAKKALSTGSTATLQFYLNSTPDMTGTPTTIAVLSSDTFSRLYHSLSRFFTYNDGVLIGFNQALTNDLNYSSSAFIELSIDITVKKYLIVTITRGGGTVDTVTSRDLKIVGYPKVN